jgi:hypothetical protein
LEHHKSRRTKEYLLMLDNEKYSISFGFEEDRNTMIKTAEEYKNSYIFGVGDLMTKAERCKTWKLGKSLKK